MSAVTPSATVTEAAVPDERPRGAGSGTLGGGAPLATTAPKDDGTVTGDLERRLELANPALVNQLFAMVRAAHDAEMARLSRIDAKRRRGDSKQLRQSRTDED